MNGALSAFTANPEKMDETIQSVANFDFQEAKRHFWIFFIRLQNKIATFDISDFFDSIGVAQVGYFIGSIVELIVEILIGAITFGASTVASITAKLGKVFETIVGTILSIIRKFYNITKNITVDTATFFLNILRKGADEFGKLMDEIWEAIKKWLDEFIAKTGKLKIYNVEDLKKFALKQKIKLSESELLTIIKITTGKANLCDSIVLSLKEIKPGKTIAELVKKFKIKDIPLPQSLSNYQTRIWYTWKKSQSKNKSK